MGELRRIIVKRYTAESTLGVDPGRAQLREEVEPRQRQESNTVKRERLRFGAIDAGRGGRRIAKVNVVGLDREGIDEAKPCNHFPAVVLIVNVSDAEVVIIEPGARAISDAATAPQSRFRKLFPLESLAVDGRA